jgi:hypothetical protein
MKIKQKKQYKKLQDEQRKNKAKKYASVRSL